MLPSVVAQKRFLVPICVCCTAVRILQQFDAQALHAESFFVGFQADDSAAIRVAAGARGGFKDCTFNNNAATNHGSSVGMDSGATRDIPAACWFQSCIFANNFDSQGYALSQTDKRALHYNNRAFQKSVDAENGGLLVPEPIDFENLKMLGFLIADADTFQEISSVRPNPRPQHATLVPMFLTVNSATFCRTCLECLRGASDIVRSVTALRERRQSVSAS